MKKVLSLKKFKDLLRAKSRSFTLSELLIAITITALVVEAAFFASNIGQKTFKSTSTEIEIIQNSRVVLDRMSREIRQSTDIITILPQIDNDPENPPSTEIVFEDGHVAHIQYITYRLDGTNTKRIVTAYYFGASLPAEEEWVLITARDESNNPPNSAEIQNETIGENISVLSFWGDPLVHISLTTSKEGQSQSFQTSINARNQ